MLSWNVKNLSRHDRFFNTVTVGSQRGLLACAWLMSTNRRLGKHGYHYVAHLIVTILSIFQMTAAENNSLATGDKSRWWRSNTAIVLACPHNLYLPSSSPCTGTASSRIPAPTALWTPARTWQDRGPCRRTRCPPPPAAASSPRSASRCPTRRWGRSSRTASTTSPGKPWSCWRRTRPPSGLPPPSSRSKARSGSALRGWSGIDCCRSSLPTRRMAPRFSVSLTASISPENAPRCWTPPCCLCC